MFATVHAAGSSLLGLFTSCTTFDSTSSAAAGSTAQAVSRLGSASLAWHRQAVRSERNTDLFCCIASPPRAARRRAAVAVLSSRAGQVDAYTPPA
eukprot:scaffold7099_cov131-Isochrysis_galbana.AAC.1